MIDQEPQPTPPPSSRFSQFSMRTLLLLCVVLGASLAVFGAWGIVVFGLVVGLAIYFHEAESLSSLTFVILVVLCLWCLIGLLLPGVQDTHELGRRSVCRNNLHQIAAALNAYRQAHGSFPLACVADKNGKPMHSWRVLILPYLDVDALYQMYNFSEPWDGPNNKKLLSIRLPMLECPSTPHTQGGTQTNYVAVVGADTAWTGSKPTKSGPPGLSSTPSETIMLVEVADSGIAWSEPRDLSLDVLGAANGNSVALALTSDHGRRDEFFFTYDHAAGVHVAMADGSVQFLRVGNRSPKDLQKLLQVGGSKEEDFGDPERRLNWPNIAALAVWLLSVGAC